MSHIDQGPLSHYNSLSDNHLSGFFNNARMRRHLRKSGLINKDGYIVSEKMYRLNMCRKEQKKHVKDMIAQAIVHKTLDLERTRQAEIRKKLEEIAKIELVRNIKMSRQRKRDVEVLPFINSRSGSGHRSHSNPANNYSKRRSVSAPFKTAKRPVSQLSSNYDDDDEDIVVYLDDEGRPIPKSHLHESEGRLSKKDVIDTRNLYSLNTTALRKYALLMAKMEQNKNGPDSPYLEPQVPLPPKSPRSGRMPRSARRYMSVTNKQKQSSPQRPATAVHKQTGGSPQRLRVQQVPKCQITMCYLGSKLNLAREKFDKQQEIIIEQQHCGGNTLTVFKGKLEPGQEFTFMSYRHCGYPFALTMYIDGQTDSRISTCCEYRHRKGCRIFGRNGHFSLVEISIGAHSCYKCQIEHNLNNENSNGVTPNHPGEDQEEVDTYEPNEEETPREDKEKDDLIDEPPKHPLEVPVEDDDPKANDKYDDDEFESSSSDSNSSRSSRSSKRSTKSRSSSSESDKDSPKIQRRQFIEQITPKIEISKCIDESNSESSYDDDQDDEGSASSEESHSTNIKNKSFMTSQQYCPYLKYPDKETGIYIEKKCESQTSSSCSVEDKQEVMSANNNPGSEVNQKVKRNVLCVNTDLADTADEVSEIESEIAQSPEVDGNFVQFFGQNHLGDNKAVEDLVGNGRENGHVSEARAIEKKEQKKITTIQENESILAVGPTQLKPDGKGRGLKRVRIKEAPEVKTDENNLQNVDMSGPDDKTDQSVGKRKTRKENQLGLIKQKKTKRQLHKLKFQGSGGELHEGNSMQTAFDGTINTIPMARTGQNKYLKRQEQKDARRKEKKKSKDKPAKDTTAGKKYKDLSPKERVIPGYSWDSNSEEGDESNSRVIPCNDVNSASEEVAEMFHVGTTESHRMVEMSESLIQENIPHFSVLNGGNNMRTVVALENVNPNFRYVTGVDDPKPKGVLGHAPASMLSDQEVDSQSRDGSVDGQADPLSLHISDQSSTHVKQSDVSSPVYKPRKCSQTTGQSNVRLKSNQTKSPVQQRGSKYDRVDEVSECSSTLTDTLEKVDGCNVTNGIKQTDGPGRNKDVAGKSDVLKEEEITGPSGHTSDVNKQDGINVFEDNKEGTDLDCSHSVESLLEDYISQGNKPENGSGDSDMAPRGEHVNDTENLPQFFANDNQDTDVYNTAAEIVRTRYVEKEADRYVRHHKVFEEPPLIDNRIFVDAGEKIMILRPQSPSEIEPDAEPVVFSILRPGDRYDGPIIRPSMQRKQYKNSEETSNVRSEILVPDNLEETVFRFEDDEMVAGDDNWEDIQQLQDFVRSNKELAHQDYVRNEGRNWYEVTEDTGTSKPDHMILFDNGHDTEREEIDSEEISDNDGSDNDGGGSDVEGSDSDDCGSSSDDTDDSDDETSEDGEDKRLKTNDIINMEDYPRDLECLTNDVREDKSLENISTGRLTRSVQDDEDLVMNEDESIRHDGEGKQTGKVQELTSLTADPNGLELHDRDNTEPADLTGTKDGFPVIEISTVSYSNIETYEDMNYSEMMNGTKNTERKQTLQVPTSHIFEDDDLFKTRPFYGSGTRTLAIFPALDLNGVDGIGLGDLTVSQERKLNKSDSDHDRHSTMCHTTESHTQSVKYNGKLNEDSVAKEIMEGKGSDCAEVNDVYETGPDHEGELYIKNEEETCKDLEANDGTFSPISSGESYEAVMNNEKCRRKNSLENIVNNDNNEKSSVKSFMNIEDNSEKNSVNVLIACLEEQLIQGSLEHSGIQSTSTGSTRSSFELDQDGNFFEDNREDEVKYFNQLPDSTLYPVDSSAGGHE